MNTPIKICKKCGEKDLENRNNTSFYQIAGTFGEQYVLCYDCIMSFDRVLRTFLGSETTRFSDIDWEEHVGDHFLYTVGDLNPSQAFAQRVYKSSIKMYIFGSANDGSEDRRFWVNINNSDFKFLGFLDD